jgi:hypothetical protein
MSGNPSVEDRGVRNLAPWTAAAAPTYIRGALTPPSLSHTSPSKSSTFNLFEALLMYVF